MTCQIYYDYQYHIFIKIDYYLHVVKIINIFGMRLQRVILCFIIILAISAQQNTPGSVKKQSFSLDPISVDPISVDPIVSEPILRSESPEDEVYQQVEPSVASQLNNEQYVQNKQAANVLQYPNKQELGEENKIGNRDSQNLSPDHNPDPRLNREKKYNNQQQQLKMSEQQQKIRAQQVRRAKAQQNIKKAAQNNPKIQEIKRSQKYKAQQQRLNKLRQKRQKYEEDRKKQLDINNKSSGQAKVVEDNVSETERARMQEKSLMRTVLRQFLEDSMENVIFEINTQVEQFMLRPSTNMVMYVKLTVYTEKNNVYGYIDDVATSKPVKLYIYDHANKIIGQVSCFFEGAFKFEVKAGSTYSIKFFNSGGPKLISLHHPRFINADLMASFVSAEKGKIQLTKAKGIISGIRGSMNNLQETRMIDMSNSFILGHSMRRYFGYQIIEIVVVGFLCWMQIYFIKKMLKNPSIL